MAPSQKSKIKRIAVQNLQDQFNYNIEFVADGDTAIIIAPNGRGKTALLSLLYDCLQFRFEKAANANFTKMEVVFDNKHKWIFEKVRSKEPPDLPPRSSANRPIRYGVKRQRYKPFEIDFKAFDQRNKPIEVNSIIGLEAVPTDVLATALDQVLPVVRETFGTFRMLSGSERLTAVQLFTRYKDFLKDNSDFVDFMGDYADSCFFSSIERPNVVFVEARRLEARPSQENENVADEKIEREEIVIQSSKLALMLRKAYAEYATESQRLDRSFPNRLVDRVFETKPSRNDIKAIKEQLVSIEMRRKNFAEAGILVESDSSLAVPPDEAFEKVADALEIYIEDSRQKLSPLEDLYRRVSIFKELIDKKLHPKKLILGTEFGAKIQKGSQQFGLSSLSSGEKHEFVMLFKLIFETPQGSIVLIDEPEISLHVVWQLEFMSDLRKIMDLNTLQSLIATHSPQILQNSELYVQDLAEQV